MFGRHFLCRHATVAPDTNHVCKLCFMCSVGAKHQLLLQFKSPKLLGESPLKFGIRFGRTGNRLLQNDNVSQFLILIFLSVSLSLSLSLPRVVKSTILPPSTLNPHGVEPGISEARAFFPSETPGI